MGDVEKSQVESILDSCEQISPDEAKEKLQGDDYDESFWNSLLSLFSLAPWQFPQNEYGPYKIYKVEEDEEYLYRNDMNDWYVITSYEEYQVIHQWIEQMKPAYSGVYDRDSIYRL